MGELTAGKTRLGCMLCDGAVLKSKHEDMTYCPKCNLCVTSLYCNIILENKDGTITRIKNYDKQ
jgi:hypothetical protein